MASLQSVLFHGDQVVEAELEWSCSFYVYARSKLCQPEPLGKKIMHQEYNSSSRQCDCKVDPNRRIVREHINVHAKKSPWRLSPADQVAGRLKVMQD
jgi:hypothetical protein